jgi:protein-S-isoprenylcysteine O-methyltransferase Ste14
MQNHVGALTIVLLIGMVLTRVFLMKRKGLQAMHFGKIDRKDFLIPPFAFFYFYLVFAAAFNFPAVSQQRFLQSGAISWLGGFLCLVSLVLMLLSLLAFGESFRVGIDIEEPNSLVTGGIFAFSRNPIYVAFGFFLMGQFLIFSNWIPLLYIGAVIWLFHHHVLPEEDYLKEHYGGEFIEYCSAVRWYL